MRLDAECYPCMMAQSYRAAVLSGMGGDVLRDVMRSTASVLRDVDPHSSPPEAAALFYDMIKERSGIEDPFLDLKAQSNHEALQLLPMLREDAGRYPDPFFYALRAAVAGNIIDFGAREQPGDLAENLAAVLDSTPFIDHGPALRRDLERASSALIVCDNAGEIVMDRFLCEALQQEFPGVDLIAAVRGGPAINDALLDDAFESGLGDFCRVITTGLAMAGVDIERSSPVFRESFEAADVIIAKGQGNFETLEDSEANIYFLFQVKCGCVSSYLGAVKGQAVIWNRNEGSSAG